MIASSLIRSQETIAPAAEHQLAQNDVAIIKRREDNSGHEKITIRMMQTVEPAVAAVVPLDPTQITEFYISQGVLGTTCAVLGLVIWRLWLRLEAKELTHKAEILAKDKLINELQDERLKEAKEGYGFAKSIQSTLDAFLVAMRAKG